MFPILCTWGHDDMAHEESNTRNGPCLYRSLGIRTTTTPALARTADSKLLMRATGRACPAAHLTRKRFRPLIQSAAWAPAARHRITKGLADGAPVFIHTVLVSKYSSTAWNPFSRPMPESLTPPNGAMKLTARYVFTQTV